MNRASMNTVSAAALLFACAGSASAAIPILPTDVIVWGGLNVGRAVPGAPSDTTWTWKASSPSNPSIDGNGRVMLTAIYTATPAVGTLVNPRGMFTGTSSADFALLSNAADMNTGNMDGTSLNPGNSTHTINGFTSSSIFVSGGVTMFGAQYNGPGVNETATAPANPNNSSIFMVTPTGLVAVATRNDAVQLRNSSNVLTNVTISSDMKTVAGGQQREANSSGVLLASYTVQAQTGFTAAAAGGNNSFIATKTAGGAYNVVAQGGTTAPVTGGIFQNGGSGNGVQGFFTRINRNGQVGFGAKLVNAGAVTTANDEVTYIYTPGSGYTLAWREGNTATDAAGNPDAGNAKWSTGFTASQRGFSNAGIAFYNALSGGDVTTADANTRNDSGIWLASTSGTRRVLRRNDVAPGFTAGDNVRVGQISTVNLGINNGGNLLFGTALQGSGVIPKVNVQTDFLTGIVTASGNMGNDNMLVYGQPNALTVIARAGDAAPGLTGFYLDVNASSANLCGNNSGDVVFRADTTPYAPGVTIGVVGQPFNGASTVGPAVLYGWNTAFGLVPLMVQGQSVEVDPGVFKTLANFSLLQFGNGDGACQGLNDAGQFVVQCNFTDGTWADIKLQVPTPGVGALALLGLGVASRRRRLA
jgi:hypothetical protein